MGRVGARLRFLILFPLSGAKKKWCVEILCGMERSPQASLAARIQCFFECNLPKVSGA